MWIIELTGYSHLCIFFIFDLDDVELKLNYELSTEREWLPNVETCLSETGISGTQSITIKHLRLRSAMLKVPLTEEHFKILKNSL